MKIFVHKNHFILSLVILYLFFISDCTKYCIAKDQNFKSLPILSGPVTVLPWDNEEAFLKAKGENNTSRLIAAYKTVLLDPLPGEEYNVHLAAKLLSGTIINAGSIFSMNNSIGPYTVSKGFRKGPTYVGTKLINTTGGGICKVATTLYNTAVLSNLQISERHYHSMPVSYIPYGQDATVSYGCYDFAFKNNASSSILIWAQGIGDTLYIGFYGDYIPPKVEWHHETLDVTKTTTIYIRNQKLTAGTKRTLVEGMDGMTVKSYVNIIFPDGTVEVKNMGISRYRPLPYVVEIGQ